VLGLAYDYMRDDHHDRLDNDVWSS
jgi:hypothetical protein